MVQRPNRSIYRTNDRTWYEVGRRLLRILHPRQTIHHKHLAQVPEPSTDLVEGRTSMEQGVVMAITCGWFHLGDKLDGVTRRCYLESYIHLPIGNRCYYHYRHPELEGRQDWKQSLTALQGSVNPNPQSTGYSHTHALFAENQSAFNGTIPHQVDSSQSTNPAPNE